MDIALDDVRAYCRIDDSGEDDFLLALIDAAKDYLAGAGVPDPEGQDPLYLLAVKAMVLHFYDHRGMTENGAPAAIPGMQNAVVQLKLRAEAARIAEVGTCPTA